MNQSKPTFELDSSSILKINAKRFFRLTDLNVLILMLIQWPRLV